MSHSVSQTAAEQTFGIDVISGLPVSNQQQLLLMMLQGPNRTKKITTFRSVRRTDPRGVNTTALVRSIAAQLGKSKQVVATSEVSRVTSSRRRRTRRAQPRTGLYQSPSAAACYLRKMVSPFGVAGLCRYPDDVMVPTALASQEYTFTATVATADATNGSFTALTTTWLDGTFTNSGTNTPSAYTGSDLPGPMLIHVPFDGVTVPVSYNWPVNTTLSGLVGGMRPVCAAIGLSITGLPSSTFMASGRYYFLQVPAVYWINWFGNSTALSSRPRISEATAQAMVYAGKGFSVDAEEIRRRGEVFIPWSPASPLDYAMKVNPLIAWNNYYSSSTGIPPSGQPNPISNNTDWDANVPPEVLCVLGYAETQATRLTYRFTVGYEYTPTAAASGIVATGAPVASATERDTIANGIRSITSAYSGKNDIRELPDYLGGDRPTGVPRLEDAAAGAGGPSLASILGAAGQAVGAFAAGYIATRGRMNRSLLG